MASSVHNWKTPGAVWSISISPDGSRIAAGCGNDVVIRNADNGEMVLGPLMGHLNRVWCVVFAPDARTLASGSWDHTIRVWDTENGNTVMQPLTGHTQHIRSVAFTPDGRRLVSGSEDRSIRIWNAQTGRTVGQPINTGSHVLWVAVSPDGTKIAAGCGDNNIKTYDAAARTLLFQCTGHKRPLRSVTFSPDGRHIASGSRDCTVCLWDGTNGHAIGDPLFEHANPVRSVSFSSDGRYVVSGSQDNTVRIWDVESGAMVGNPLVGHADWVYAVAFMPDGTCVVSGSYDKTIKIWDVHHLLIQPLVRTHQALVSEPDIEITSVMSLKDIISHLSTRGCADMSDSLDWNVCGTHPISSGGFGDIYRGKLKTGQEVAIKTIRIYIGASQQNRKALKRAAREVYTWSKCRHPNVQPLRGLVVFRDQIGMIATWEANGSLPEYLQRHPEADRCAISTQVSDGLAYLHATGVIHGDLKGANVLVAEDGRAQLADFGNATLQEYTLQFSATTTSEKYSFRWAAPELFQDGKCSKEADVYALGMTILEAITGKVPWAGKKDPTIMFAVLSKAHPERPMKHIPLDSISGEELWALLQSCWAFEPKNRPTAAEAARIMQGITPADLKRG